MSVKIRKFNWQSIFRITDKVGWVAFLLFMLCLPITSFPFLPPAIGGGAIVRPLSLYPLFVVILLIIVPRLFTTRLPRQFLALGGFVVIVILTGIVSLFRETNLASEISNWERVLRALITLGLGCAYYLAVVLTPRSLAELRSALIAMYAGFTLALSWSSLQLIYVLHFNRHYFRIINQLQGWISTRRLFENRISGLTYEPNWFAEQITMLLLPWLLASVLSGTSLFRPEETGISTDSSPSGKAMRRSSRYWRWLTVELGLLIWSIGILLFTYSRAGLLNFGILLMVVLIIANIRYLNYIRQKQIAQPDGSYQNQTRTHAKNGLQRARRASLLFLAQVTVVVMILAGAFYIVGTKNTFFARLWQYWRRPNITLEGYLTYLGFEARLIYGEAAYKMYQEYPVFGVGPGNYALYFNDSLPYKPLARTPEVLRLVTPDEARDRLVTPKIFPLRLLAETGIIGFAAFTAFFISIVISAFHLVFDQENNPKVTSLAIGANRSSFDTGSANPQRGTSQQIRKPHLAMFWGAGSILALIAFLFSTLSFDSFALPNMWVSFGLITAASILVKKERSRTLQS